MEPTALEQALFRTLAYFAYFQFPLTTREMYTWLLAPERAYEEHEVEECLAQSLWLKKHSERYGVYISLKDCEHWVREREKKYIDAQRKYHKALRVASYIMRIPGVTAVAICNSLAWFATSQKSDIDLFIVTRPGTIWAVRLFVTFPLKLLRMRPGETANDPICASFFTDESTTNLSFLREGEEDWYLPYWVASLRWIGGGKEYIEKFFSQNVWVQLVLPHAQINRLVSSMVVKPVFRIPLFFPESLAKKIQEKLFSKTIQEQRNKTTHVVVTDHMLKFHHDDRRAAIAAFVRLHMQQAGL